MAIFEEDIIDFYEGQKAYVQFMYRGQGTVRLSTMRPGVEAGGGEEGSVQDSGERQGEHRGGHDRLQASTTCTRSSTVLQGGNLKLKTTTTSSCRSRARSSSSRITRRRSTNSTAESSPSSKRTKHWSRNDPTPGCRAPFRTKSPLPEAPCSIPASTINNQQSAGEQHPLRESFEKVEIRYQSINDSWSF